MKPKPSTWFSVVKMLTPRQFLENFQSKVGGEITGTTGRVGSNYTLDGDVKITVKQRKGGQYNVMVKGDETTFFEEFNLTKLLDKVEGVL